METLAKRIVHHWIQRGLVEESYAEWYAYALLERLTTLCTFSVVVVLGAFVSNAWCAFLFATVLMYLRAYTNGHHAKTYLLCVINSCLIEILGVFLSKYLMPILSLLLAFGSAVIILIIAPINNDQIHYSAKEFAAVRTACHTRLTIVLVLHIVLLPFFPVCANCVSLAMSADAFLLLIAKRK